MRRELLHGLLLFVSCREKKGSEEREEVREKGSKEGTGRGSSSGDGGRGGVEVHRSGASSTRSGSKEEGVLSHTVKGGWVHM